VYPVLFHIGSVLIPAYGAVAALGVVLALLLALRTARMVGVDPNQVWNLCILSLFTALVGSRLVLIVVNWTVLRSHPAWLLGLSMIHHPLLAAIGALLAASAAVLYARWQRLPLCATADALAAPLALGLAMEQVGALLAGSGFGLETAVPWAITYTNPMAARWSGAPLGTPVHPVQAYAALAFLTIALLLLVGLSFRRQHGDVAGLWLLAAGTAIYITEFWRDPEGRGSLLRGALDSPQVAAVALVLAAGLLLRERPRSRIARHIAPSEANHG
jgi:phosphatidylglycerol:prolipoprotein diacylglycerol transferase